MENLIDSEVNRCLTCNNARCSKGCPISTVIPEIINLYREGDLDRAGEILFENNPLSLICSIVCPHEDNCMGNCILGIKGDSVNFPSIEREISERYLKETDFVQNISLDKRIAVIGSGPAGLTMAFIMAKKGYSVTIFEKLSQIGGVLRYGIPEFRLSKDILDIMEERLIQLGVKIRYNDLIGPVNNVNELIEDGYSAVFIGTGVWNPRPLRIKGETFGHVHYAINYLKSPGSFNLGKKVAVIGAGNVAMDAARTAKRNGAEEVFVLYRKGIEDMKATRAEIEEAKEDGVKFRLHTTPLEIVDEGIVVEDTKDTSSSLFNCDTIIIAVSQTPATNIVSARGNSIETNTSGLVLTDEGGHTTSRGIFASGDVVSGARTVVEAVAATKEVAAAICEYISGLNN